MRHLANCLDTDRCGIASYGLCVRRLVIFLFRKTVMMLLSIMDPDGTENRKQRKIIRRTYRNHSKQQVIQELLQHC